MFGYKVTSQVCTNPNFLLFFMKNPHMCCITHAGIVIKQVRVD